MNLDIRGCLGSRHYQSRNFSRSIFFLFSLSFFFFQEVYKYIFRDARATCNTYGDRAAGEAILDIAISACHGDKMERRKSELVYSSHWHEQNFTTDSFMSNDLNITKLYRSKSTRLLFSLA